MRACVKTKHEQEFLIQNPSEHAASRQRLINVDAM